MACLVTGATGFIGRHLVPLLLARGEHVFVIVRPQSIARFEALNERWGGGERVVAVLGDLNATNLGVDAERIAELRGKVDHFFHLAALYDMTASADELRQSNLDGTRHAVQLAEAVEAGIFHHTSSIAAAGRYLGVFREDMFDEAEGLEDPYFRTKHDSEGIVRNACRIPWRVYRPGVVIGHSVTGEIDKIDGPYYFFKLIQRIRGALPAWVPLIGIEGGPINIVPVDFVAAAMDAIAFQDGHDGKAFHLVDPDPLTVAQAMNEFARAAHAPEFAMRIEADSANLIPKTLRLAVSTLQPLQRIVDTVLADLGIPRRVIAYAEQPTHFDCRDTTKALEGTGISVPHLNTYAAAIWDYWERNLDPDLFRDRSLRGAIEGKRIVITGASSGIGEAVARDAAAAGATVLLVARSAEKLEDLAQEIREAGGTAYVHSADLASDESCAALVAEIEREHGGVDILLNNAGRSIRRSLTLSQGRFHDYERTMQLNYFGSLRLIFGFLPGMQERRRGHIINVSSIGVQTNPPRFSAYVASKAALDAFSRCAASELVDDGIAMTTVYMPLVKTKMIAPTKIYDAFPKISAQEASDMICGAMISRTKRVSTRMGLFGQISYAIAPKAVDIVLNMAYRIFPDSAAAKGDEPNSGAGVSAEAKAFAHLIPGVHW